MDIVVSFKHRIDTRIAIQSSRLVRLDEQKSDLVSNSRAIGIR